ncbi:MAG TPA: glycosyltransferase family 4 protein [Anaerohalosphaeraceae bacterium]|nr:glycosyltransferase family 4 protein [Anaerohalosphaeraceae bacterium]HOL89389.1 glycosyltransferase family 4 protein [Anaerohalosphaeraceae bacterium]HPP54948.1 glycosyltransferase family 4 protein [Anaerohalosphaeraceae bacterium]
MLEKTKIAFVSTIPNTLFFYIELLKALQNAGARLTLITSENPFLEKLTAQLDCQAERVPFSRSLSPFRDWQTLCRLTKLFRTNRFDLVHAHTPKAGFLSMKASAAASVPVRLYTIHGLVGDTASFWKRQIFSFCEKRACRYAHQVLAVSPSLRRQLVEEGLCPAGKVSVLRDGSACGIDVDGLYVPTEAVRQEARRIREHFQIPAEAVVLGFVGRLTPEKGIPMLLDVFGKLARNNPLLHLLMVGRMDEVREKLDARSLSLIREHPRIHWAGHIPFPAAYYAAMDIFVMPSRREGFGMCNIEAAAMGVPVAASRITGCVDSVRENVTGLLFQRDDPQDLARCLMRLIDDPQLRRKMGQEGTRWVRERFSSRLLVQEHLHLYECLLAQRGS